MIPSASGGRPHSSADRATRRPARHSGLVVLRPADANEAVEAWRVAIRQTQPVCLALSRQKLSTIDRTRYASAAGVARGAYVLADAGPGRPPEVILIGTGSEVALCLQAFEQLEGEGICARVVSMPSWELFEQQDQAYRNAVLPPEISARFRSRPARPSAGIAMSGRPAKKSACTVSARRRRLRTC